MDLGFIERVKLAMRVLFKRPLVYGCTLTMNAKRDEFALHISDNNRVLITGCTISEKE